MSHEIAKTADGRDAFAYTGEKGWHGLGQHVTKGAPLEVWAQEAGFDFTIKRSRIRYATERDQDVSAMSIYSGREVLFRSDNGAGLGIVSPDYKLFQPIECLEFFRNLVDGAGFTMETAGILFDGKRCFATAAIGADAMIAGHDKIGGFLLAATACDGTMQSTFKFVCERVVCKNTLSIALGETAKDHGLVKVPHSTRVDIAAVQRQLNIGREQFDAFAIQAQALAETKISTADSEAFLSKLFTEFSAKKENIQNLAGYKKVFDLFNGSGMGADFDSAKGTRWGLLNAVTEFVDHHARAQSAQHRMNSAQFGAGDDMKARAAQLLAVA